MPSEASTSRPRRRRASKKTYSKPAAMLVPLRPEEAVLAGCKVPPGGTSFTTCGLSGCVTMGS